MSWIARHLYRWFWQAGLCIELSPLVTNWNLNKDHFIQPDLFCNVTFFKAEVYWCDFFFRLVLRVVTGSAEFWSTTAWPSNKYNTGTSQCLLPESSLRCFSLGNIHVFVAALSRYCTSWNNSFLSRSLVHLQLKNELVHVCRASSHPAELRGGWGRGSPGSFSRRACAQTVGKAKGRRPWWATCAGLRVFCARWSK